MLGFFVLLSESVISLWASNWSRRSLGHQHHVRRMKLLETVQGLRFLVRQSTREELWLFYYLRGQLRYLDKHAPNEH